MASFPNGTAGDIFMEGWCDRCRHFRERPDDPMGADGPGCPIWDAHLFAEKAHANPERRILDALIFEHQTDDGADDPICRMFEPQQRTAFTDTEELDALLGFTPGCEPAWHERIDRIREMRDKLSRRESPGAEDGRFGPSESSQRP